MMSRSSPLAAMRRRRLATALAALAAPAIAGAQSTPREQELEARVAQLEAQVQMLLQMQQSQQTAPAAPATPTPPTPPPAPRAAAIQDAPITPQANPGTRFSFGGFIKLDAMASATSDGKITDGSSGRLFHNPQTIPAAVGAAPDTGIQTDLHAQFSRFSFSVDHRTDDGRDVKAYIEADMYGGGSNALAGNEAVSNTYAITLRHAYVRWGDWLAGQTWSNFMDVAAMPDTVDFVGITDGTVFVRQAQLRYRRGPWSFSLENPQTTLTTFQNAQPRYSSGDNTLPDASMRWLHEGDWGHFTIAGLLRQLKNGDDTATGAALSISGKFGLGDADDIRYALNGGRGIGRYLALGTGSDAVRDATGIGADAAPGADAGDIHPITALGGFLAWRHVFTPKLRGNLMYAASRFDNPERWTGDAVTRSTRSIHANLIYSPLPQLDLGAELGWGERELENREKGQIRRLHTSVKYSF